VSKIQKYNKTTKTRKGGHVMPKAKINQGGRREGKKHITNPRRYFQSFCKSGKMKSILTLLTAVVLFGLTFNLSSCKQCDKEGKNLAGEDGNTNNTPNTPSDTATSNGVSSDGDGKTPGASNTQDLVPTKTLEELKADIIKLVNAAGRLGNDEDNLFRDMYELALNIDLAIDSGVALKRWTDKFYLMWLGRKAWIWNAIEPEFINDPPYIDKNEDAYRRTCAEEHGVAAEKLYSNAMPDLEKIRRKDYDGLLKQREKVEGSYERGYIVEAKPAETPEEFAARKKNLHDNLIEMEGKMGDAERIWKELTKAVDAYRILKAKQKGK
jgi:hypothetical protein